MPDYRNQKDCFIQNLKDAGCQQSMIKKCEQLKDNQDLHHLMQILTQHRNYLLDQLHQSQSQIDCLDYLIYQINKS